VTDAKVRPDRDVLTEVLRRAEVPAPERARVEEIQGGTFNTAYRVVADDRRLVLKIAPRPEVAGMSYERDLLATEAMFYLAAAEAMPVPEVVHTDFGRDLLPSDWLLMTECAGANWYDSRERIGPADRSVLRTQLGDLVARLHRVTGKGFGYPQNGLVSDWATAFTSMVRAVLDDAVRYGVELPVPAERLHDLLESSHGALDEVVRPSLVHFDLWEGNVLVDPDRLRVTGVVDGERAFWGDPLADMASLGLFGLIEDDEDFLAGYRLAGGAPALDPSARRRLDLYRCYLYLIMTVEAAPRGAAGPDHEQLNRLVGTHLRRAVDRLERGRP
jgi:aminoglycoside phosphotransferase (APT) family kinase protein